MPNRIMPGYINQLGDKMEIIIDHDGPASYNNTGTFATSGETINAADFGLGGFELVQVDALSSDGLNYGYVVLPNMSNSNTPQSIGANAVPTAVIHWYVLSTNVEVANTVNLSGKALRLQIRGV